MGLDRRLLALVAAVAFSAAVVVPTGLGSRSATPVPLPTLYVNYTNQCTFTVVNDAGQQVTSLAPGRYELDISTPVMFRLLAPGGPSGNPNDFTGCNGYIQFQMTGPGVSAASTLDNGCTSNAVVGTWTLQPSSTYTLVDLNQPAATKTTITTSATGTPQQPTTSPYDATSGKGTLSTDPVGSDVTPSPRGTLKGDLAANGKLTLTLKGKPVSTLQSGRYTFTIIDRDPKGGVMLHHVKVTPRSTVLSGNAFIGEKTTTVLLGAGRWTISASAGKVFTLTVS
jgi:hypothetical protein